MILEEKNIISNNEIMYLTTSLGSYNNKFNKWDVPYVKMDASDMLGSKRAGFWHVKKYNDSDCLLLIPINEKDIKKLIRHFSKPRSLSYLQEIKEEEGIVPYFLEHLLKNI